MQPNIETLQGLERRLTVAVPLAEIDNQVNERLKKLAVSTNMPGFRRGKVPVRLVAQQYGPQVRGEVIGDAVQKAFSDAVTAQNVRVAGYPKIERKDGASAEQLEFNATFEVYPEVVLGDLGAASIERPMLEVSDAEVDRTIESLRKQRVTFEEVTRAAESGDRVTIDFTGRIDGNEFQGGSATGFPFVLGERKMLPEFEAAVIGLAAGGTKTFPLKFPDDYAGKDVAGKTAEFEVRIVKVEAAKLPPVDAEFAKTLGVTDGDLGKMRSEIRDNVDREVKQRLKSTLKQRVMEALLGSTKPEVPNALVELEQSRLVESARTDLQSRGMKDVDKVPIDPGMFREQATRRVTLGLILGEIVKQQQLGAKPEQVRKLVEDYARSFEQPFEVVKWVYSQSDRLAEFEGLAVEENVVNWVLSKAQVQDQPVKFEELMGGVA
jgi:trigger factor